MNGRSWVIAVREFIAGFQAGLSHLANTIPTCLERLDSLEKQAWGKAGSATCFFHVFLGWPVPPAQDRSQMNSGLLVGSVVTLKPQLCPLCAGGEGL